MVDNVRVKLFEARNNTNRELAAAAATPARNLKTRFWRYPGKLNNKGRYHWSAKLYKHPMDTLMPGVVRCCCLERDQDKDEYMAFFEFASCVHYNTFNKMLRDAGHTVLYTRRSTLDEVELAMASTNNIYTFTVNGLE